jgi:Protein of unknown function (DUF3309)
VNARRRAGACRVGVTFAAKSLQAHTGTLPPEQENTSLYTILIVVLILLLLGALPTWPYSGGWGYYPSGGLGLVLLIVVVLLLVGRI